MSNYNIYKVKGMHCASCASIIERTVGKIDGVESVEVNPGTENAKISFNKEQISVENFNKKLEPLGYTLVAPKDHAGHSMGNMSTNMTAKEMNMSEDEHREHLGLNQSKQEKLAELKEMRIKILSVIPIAIISILMMAWEILADYSFLPEMSKITEEFIHHLLPIFATYTLFVVGKPYLLGFYRFLKYRKANMDTLIGIGTVFAFLYSFIVSALEDTLRPYLNVDQNYYDITIVVIAFIAFGKYLEMRSKLKTGDAIEKLLNMQAKTALIIRDGKEIEISIGEVVHGDIIVVKPGGKIPVDGIVFSGESYIDESIITGEPMPVLKTIGSSVVAGTINSTGAFTFKATKVGSETMLAQIIKMVFEAQNSKAPIQALADKISSVFVPVVLVVAFVALGLWLILGTGAYGFSQALSYGLVSFVGVLVIACPCALGLATPTAIIVGVGKGAREGILVKDAATLEKLYKVDTLVIDKTGTLTYGKPTVVDIKDLTDTEISVLASLEKNSEHPIAGAILNFAKDKNLALEEVKNFEAIKGKGLKGVVSGMEYFAGNTKLLEDMKISFDKDEIEKLASEGKTPVLLASKDKMLGYVMVADSIKTEAIKAVKDLHEKGIKVVMLTGDNKNTAKYIAQMLGIDEVVAEVMPADKLAKVRALQAEGRVVAMAGDGVNDAPALAGADVGIAMATGTDVAIESAGITILHGDISKVVKAVKLSKITMRGIKQNLFWAFIYNIVGIPLASGIFFPFFGWLLSPVFAGLAMALSSVSVVGNSLRIKSKKL